MLPFLLAGPIVRRVTARSVSVWVALSEAANVTLTIWGKVVFAGTEESVFVPVDAPIQSATQPTSRVGNKLHIVVVTVKIAPPPAVALLPGQLYSYNVGFASASGASDLKSLKLLLDKDPVPGDPISHLALGYMPGRLPSFVLPPVTIDKTNLAHGSCRKAHAPNKDTLAALDQVIKKAVIDADPDKRPHQLFLTGDQIYADETAILLMPELNRLGTELLGTTEKLTVKDAAGATTTLDATLANFPVTRRKRTVVKNAQFSTDEGANHLLSFGEFAATYLMYWNNEVWPAEFYKTYDELKGKEDFTDIWDVDPLTDIEKQLAPLSSDEKKEFDKEKPEDQAKRIAEAKKNAKDTYQEELKEVLTFRQQLPKVRRALANVPVYMILDDHEVTDDWFITKDWRDKVLTSPLGVNILRNALMAYALFQDWGNNPVAYEADDAKNKKKSLLDNLQLVFPAGAASGPSTAATAAIDVLLGFNLTDETPPPLKWHYSVPCSETTVYVLDTRTRRTYETRYSPPGLLSKSAMDDQIPNAPQPERFLIFVSPAPVLGLATFEELLQPASTVFAPYSADPEPWAFNPPVFEDFLGRLKKFKRVLFLSGDVHFGLVAHLDYWKKGEAEPARFVQFVSSALKNQKFKNEQFLIGGFVQRLLSSLFYPVERLGWEHRAGLQVTNPAGKPNLPVQRIRLRKEPVLLPTRGWPAGSSANQVPDWRWRMSVDRDERPDDSSPDARPPKTQVASIIPDINPLSGDASASYRKVLARHMDLLKKTVGRRVEWDNNLGMVKFATDAFGKVSASQQLWYWLPDDELDDDPDAYEAATDGLEPTTDPPPTIA